MTKLYVSGSTTPVNGGWGAWSKWGQCTKSCGGGQSTRTRACDNPVPKNGGKDCTADGSKNSESKTCNSDACGGMYNLMLRCPNAYTRTI